MSTRLCFHCKNVFESDSKETYQLCPKCGAATYRHIDLNGSGGIRINEHYFKYPFGSECEDEVFRPKCLIPIQTDIAALSQRLRKIEDHLGK